MKNKLILGLSLFLFLGAMVSWNAGSPPDQDKPETIINADVIRARYGIIKFLMGYESVDNDLWWMNPGELEFTDVFNVIEVPDGQDKPETIEMIIAVIAANGGGYKLIFLEKKRQRK